MLLPVSRYQWSEFGVVPEDGGIYAWYCSPEITEFDLDQAIASVTKLKNSGDIQAAEKYVRDVLETRILRQFSEQPYNVVIDGSLKPTYRGQIYYDNSLSDSLVNRLVADPTRLCAIRDVMENSAPNFASPLYIGMAQNLRKRLNTHKSLIERHRERQFGDRSADYQNTSDAGFARQVAERKLPPERLFVVVCVMDTINGAHNDVENLLNRIYYPVLGRN